jgi:catechol 2,3-dioxygenase-like lactoylglutathione lyase family enzyme
VITIEDIAFVRYGAPDLDAMERFLLDFGMRRAVRTAGALYMRGFGEAHYLHITELSEAPATLGFGLRARGADDLSKIAAHLGTVVEDNPEPGGGRRVQFKDPAGFTARRRSSRFPIVNRSR